MHLPSLPAASLLFSSAMLLVVHLALPTNSAAGATSNATSCSPASCGGLNITFPFWLAGTHPPECGYKAFQVTCDKQGNLSLANSYSVYQLRDIFYENSSIRVDLPAGDDPCDDYCQNFYNTSSDFGLSPFKISPKNQELFLYVCDPREKRIPRTWTPVRCPPPQPGDWPPQSGDDWPLFTLLGKEYAPGGTGMPPPMNCNVSMIPVLGFEGATGADYQRLFNGGFLLEYTDAGACADCTDTGGQCRTSGTDDAFECHCHDGVHSANCGRKRSDGKIIRIVLMAAGASLLFPCIYVMVCHQKGQRLQLLLGKRAISSTERNIEALIVSYGSLAPKQLLRGNEGNFFSQ